MTEAGIASCIIATGSAIASIVTAFRAKQQANVAQQDATAAHTRLALHEQRLQDCETHCGLRVEAHTHKKHR